jgi:hypothetical protein
MAKRDIGKVLSKGSLRQRLLLLAEDTARGKYFQERLLTKEERRAIDDSIKTPREIKLYEEFRSLDETVTNAVTNLQGLSFELLQEYSTLRGYILLWHTTELAELLANSILHETKDPQERLRIANKGTKGIDLLFTETEIDPEGYLDIKVDFTKEVPTGKGKEKVATKNFTLLHILQEQKKQAETVAIRLLSWEQAILDFMEERGFNVKIYKANIKELGDRARRPIIGWAKYVGEIPTGLPHPRLEPLLKQYAVGVEGAKLEIDQEDYDWYRRYFLDRGDTYPEELRGKVNRKILDQEDTQEDEQE